VEVKVLSAFLADHIYGCADATVLRPSIVLSACVVMYCG